MTLVSKTYWTGMPFWFRRAPECEVESLVLRAHDMRQLRALWWHRGSPKVGVVVIHPRVDFAHHYAIPRLIDAGFGVLAATARHAGNDALSEYEEVVLDVAACVRYLREKVRVEKVVLLGNCGGGSLVAYYQAQARLPAGQRLTRTPAGSPTYFEGAQMTPGDGLVYLAPHRGLGKIMLEAIDPSVVDERDPLAVNPELDMYDPRNGFRAAPAWSEYDAAFLARYRAAQVARVERLDAYARERIASRTGSDREKACEEVMVAYRTMANPAYVDRTIEPSGRDYGALLSERPDLMNYNSLGLGRMATPRAWLSTWSGLASKADLVTNVAHITEPTLLVAAGRDREIYPSDIAAIENACASTDKRVETIAEARHYFEPEFGQQEGHVTPVMDLVVPWITERFGMIVVVYHSSSGRTEALAREIARAAGGIAMSVAAIDQDKLAAADAIVFGCPTYMGSASAAFKQFMDDTAAVWALQGWRDKLAAGFTHSAAPSGDKLGTLTQLSVFAAQHGMVWIGLGLPPSYASTTASDDTNRLGSHLGLMAQTPPGKALHEGDLRTAEGFGRRIAEATKRWSRPRQASVRHELARHWSAPVGAMNLKELASRPERFEHHLVVFARIGDVQLELATASEPLYFGHINISDEYALALPTGDDLVDRFPLRTFLSDARGDVGRYNHRAGEIVLHPQGTLHWPGRMRPPYEMPEIPPGMRRSGITIVYCANVPTPHAGVLVPATDERAKAYVAPAPAMSVVDVRAHLGVVAAIGATTLEVVTGAIAPPRGGWVIDLDTLEVHRLAPGGRLELARALVFASRDREPDPIASAWAALPTPPFAPLEDAPRSELPFEHGSLRVMARERGLAAVSIGDGSVDVPRYWLARTLFRLGLHDLRLGYVETYGGMSFDDHAGGDLDIGVAGAKLRVPRGEAMALVELYRAVAPANYTERLR